MAPDADIGKTTGSSDPFAPLTSEHLDVGDGHAIYVESVGRRDGIAAVYLHGGPGSGCQPDHRRLFDPQRFHTILFDQRGAGRSKPKGKREANTLPHLIADIETIRTKFGFDKWLVVGGSWGATLALAYAQAHPDRVTGIVLRATFLGTREELHDVFNVMLPRHYPGLHGDFLSALPEAERADPLPNFYRRILDADPAVHVPAIRAWGGTEAILSEIAPKRARLDLAELGNQTRPMPATTALCGRISSWKTPANSPAFPASSFRAVTTSSARPRHRTLWPGAGRMLRCASLKAPVIACMTPACAMRS
jgi:proline iminopeptidase